MALFWDERQVLNTSQPFLCLHRCIFQQHLSTSYTYITQQKKCNTIHSRKKHDDLNLGLTWQPSSVCWSGNCFRTSDSPMQKHHTEPVSYSLCFHYSCKGTLKTGIFKAYLKPMCWMNLLCVLNMVDGSIKTPVDNQFSVGNCMLPVTASRTNQEVVCVLSIILQCLIN